MVTFTITVAALVATSILGYLMYKYKNEAESSKIKFNATKEFADVAASKIIKLEATLKEATNTIILLRSKIEASASKQAPAIKVETVNKIDEVKTTEVAKPKPRRRYKNKNKAKDTNQI